MLSSCMEKVTFKATVKVPKAKKNQLTPGDVKVNVFHVKIEGMFNALETSTLETLLKSWQGDNQAATVTSDGQKSTRKGKR